MSRYQSDEARISVLISIISMKRSPGTTEYSEHFRSFLFPPIAISQMSGSYLCKPHASIVPVKSWIRSLSSRPCCQEFTGQPNAPTNLWVGFSKKEPKTKKHPQTFHTLSCSLADVVKEMLRRAAALSVCFSSGFVYYGWSRGHSAAARCFNFPFFPSAVSQSRPPN